MKKSFLLAALVFAFQSSSIICSVCMKQEQLMETIQRRAAWQTMLIVEELAREELGLGCTRWDLAEKMQDPKIRRKAQEEYKRQQESR
ncbi:MAG: hypothetical protein LVQ75_01440 [Candidatus Babeliales bacterium]|jgi:hypothetical protein